MYRFIVTGGFLIAAAIGDVKSRRIDNRLILSGVVIALLLRAAAPGHFEILLFIKDMCLPVILLFLLFPLRILGAGDIKLLSMISCFLGFGFDLYVIWTSFLMTAVYGVIRMIIKRKTELTVIPFAVPVLLGFVTVVAAEYMGMADTGLTLLM